MKYQDGREVILGDLVEHGGAPGQVVGAPVADGSFVTLPGFEGTESLGTGIWVRFQANGAVVELARAETNEDLQLISRKREALES